MPIGVKFNQRKAGKQSSAFWPFLGAPQLKANFLLLLAAVYDNNHRPCIFKKLPACGCLAKKYKSDWKH